MTKKYLAAALTDASLYIRIGAAFAVPRLLETEQARDILTRRADEIDTGGAAVEAAALAVSLARVGGNGLNVAAALLGSPEREVEAALSGDHDGWVHLLDAKIREHTLPVAAGRVILPLRAATIIGRMEPTDDFSDAPTPGGMTAQMLKSWRGMVTSFGRHSDLDQLLENAFEPVFKALEDHNIAAATQSLVHLAITAPPPWVRIIAHKGLSTLEDSAKPLIKLLQGKSGPRPGLDVVESIRREAGGATLRSLYDPDLLAAFLAVDALRDFSDSGTALELARLSIAGSDQTAARATYAMEGMDAATSLPPAIWLDLNDAARINRVAGNSLIAKLRRTDHGAGLVRIDHRYVLREALG